jgi:DNA-binding NarL/FixJ family response regulator
MRVLLIEDHVPLAGLVGRELTDKHGYEVTLARDPLSARAEYEVSGYDIAVVDLLYEHLNAEFEAVLARGELTARSPGLLVSGLLAVRDISAVLPSTGIVLWTSAEANRRLHLLYAYEQMNMRVFCAKSSGGNADVLTSALRAAAAGRAFVDPVINSYLPGADAAAISATILRDPPKRAIWRALALGARTRDEISDSTRYSKRTIGNLVPGMLDDLIQLDPGIRRSSAPLVQVVSYASRNREFFLDEVIRESFP